MASRTAYEEPERRSSARRRVSSTLDGLRSTSASYASQTASGPPESSGQPRRTRLTSISGLPGPAAPSSSAGTRLRTLSTSAKPGAAAAAAAARRAEAEASSNSVSTTSSTYSSRNASAASSSNLGSRRTSWTPQKTAQNQATALTEPSNVAGNLARPSTASRIPSISRGTGTGSSRLGDALLGQRKASDSSASRSAALPTSGSTSSVSLPRRRDSLVGPRQSSFVSTQQQQHLPAPSSTLRPSVSNSSLTESASITSSMGPPSLSASTSSFATASRPRDTLTSSSSFTAERTTSNGRIRASPSLPQFDGGFSAPLFEGLATTYESSDSLTHAAEENATPMAHSQPFPASSQPPEAGTKATVGTAPRRAKPNLHLGLRESPQMSSRFSNFSSAVGTPDTTDDASRIVMMRKNSTYSNSSTSGLSDSLAKSGSEQSMAGLGIGLPSTMQPPPPPMPPPHSGSRSGDLSTSLSSVDRNPSSYNSSMPQTPDRFGEHATPNATPMMYDRAGQIGIGELATPRWNFPSSKLPNWSSHTSSLAEAGGANTASANGVDPMPRSVSGALSDDGAVPLRSLVGTAGKPRGPSGNSLVENASHFPSALQRRAEASRHSRSISYSSISSAQRSIQPPSEDPRGGLPISPSVPAVPRSLEGSVSLQALARGFGASTSEFLSDLDGVGPGSPQYSIDAMTESEHSVANTDDASSTEAPKQLDHLVPKGADAILLEASRRSPRIGDLSWSLGETGPFGTDAGGPAPDTADQQQAKAPAAEGMAFDSGVLNALESDEQWRGSFDLNAAITELLNDHDKRRQDRKGAGQEGSSSPSAEVDGAASPSKLDTLSEEGRPSDEAPLGRPDGEVRGLPQIPATLSHHGQHEQHTPSAARRAISDSPKVRDSALPSRRSRLVSTAGNSTAGLPASASATSLGSASGAPASSTSYPLGANAKVGPRLSSIAHSTSGTTRSKRSSSASIGQSLLRGSMPLGAAEEYGSILNSAKEDAAADALRKLDGLGGTPRSSRDSRSDLPKSPRVSRQMSRPGSAGRKTPGTGTGTGTGSRPSSPSSRVRRSSNYDSPASRGIDKQLRGDEPGSRSSVVRSSRILSKANKAQDDSGSAPLNGNGDGTSRTPPYASPRLRRSQLPPLPQGDVAASHRMSQGIGMGATASIREVGAPSVSRSGSRSKRTSAASDVSAAQLEASRQDGGSGGAAGSSNGAGIDEVDSLGLPSRGSGIPPVPPLPKVWEASRSASLHSEAFGSAQASPIISASQSLISTSADTSEEQQRPQQQPQQQQQQQQQPPQGYSEPPQQRQREPSAPPQRPTPSSLSPRQPTSPRLGTGNSEAGHSNLRKWSFPNLASALNRSPSTSASTATRSRQPSTSASMSALNAVAAEEAKQRRGTVYGDGYSRTEAGGAMEPGMAAARGSVNSMARIDVLKANKGGPDVSTGSPQSSRVSNDTNNSSPRVRRTPSFFQRATKRSNGSIETTQSSLHASGDADESKSTIEVTPPNSGRLSRKSIMGLAGGLLGRSTSKRNVEVPAGDGRGTTTSSAAANASTTPGRVARAVGGTSESSQQKGTSSTASRRISLVARKRGKTLPSSAEPPVVPALALPKESPEAEKAPDAREAKATPANVSTDSAPVLRALHPSSSSSSLSNSMMADIDRAARLAASYDSQATYESANNEIEEIADGASASGVSRGNSPTKSSIASSSAAGGSRIPRAATIRSSTKTLSGTASSSVASSSNGHASIYATPQQSSIRAIGSSASSVTASKAASSSLAASLGIQPTEDDSLSAVSSDATNGTAKPAVAGTAAAAAATPAKSVTSPSQKPLSSSLVSILNAYAAAKTPAEVEGVLRRARIAAYSSTLTASEREVLNSLGSRNEQHKKADSTPNGTPSSSTVGSKARASGMTEAGTPARAAKVFSTSSSAANTPAKADTSVTVPVRKVRASLSAASGAAARVSRDTANSVAGRSSRQTTSTLGNRSPAPSDSGSATSSTAAASVLDEEERLGDLEMEAYIKRSQAKKLASGAKQADLDKLLEFPDPVPPSRTLSPRQAEVMYGNKMSPYELHEIFSYPEIFYCGQNASQKHRATLDKPNNNHGFDDERGDYLVTTRDHLAFRYEIIDLLGRGSFGQVLQCRDHKTGHTVAIKLIRNKKRFHHQALVEVKILESLVKWDPEDQYNVLKITESFLFRNHLCIATELYSMNLYELIKANSFAGFSTKLIRRFTTQVLASLSLMRQRRIVHCDLKPENILLKHPRRSGIKVIDFGSSCFEHEKVILGMNYHTAIDIWSLGCIIAELYTGYPLFPGENEQEQLACIMEVLGVPDRYLIERSTRKKLFFDSTGAPRPVVNSRGKRRRPGSKTLAQALKCNDDLFVDFVAKCLIWDPERRIKPDPAMRHPWIQQGRRLASVAAAALSSGDTSLGRASGSAASSSFSSSTGPGLLPRKTAMVNSAAGTANANVATTSTSTNPTATPRTKLAGSTTAAASGTPGGAAGSGSGSGSGSTPVRSSAVGSTTGSSLAYATSPRRTSAIGVGSLHNTPLRARGA
ncbi:related to putative dual specificity protein kinase pom1 [Pseudozyma flocculosa]|uniref:dual-specificity kinase n=1 Tax=Pseudozyma flocculosa TaxID=84751 RepID=A0A5C3F3V0_9BASI|nr:related to putative dual specificity protein kinase pom1 [Pseudozyma flocculosa]